jgi:FkbM family methyltransferase
MSGSHPSLANRAWNTLRKTNGYQIPKVGLLLHKLVIAVTPREMTIELVPGISAPLDLRDETQRGTYWHGVRYEAPTPQILASWGAESSRFFDIGSNYGFFSYFMLSQFPSIEVYSFEPNPATFALVRRIQDINHLSRLHPNQIGLGDTAAELDLNPCIEDSGYSTFAATPKRHGTSVRVPVVPFDDWVENNQLPKPARPEWVAKIDVEGFEAKVLRGMAKSLDAKFFRGIAIEINEATLNSCGSNPSEIFELMRSRGYVSISDLPEGKKWPLQKTVNAFFVPAEASQ